MTACVLIVGVVFRKPEMRTSKSGRSYAAATVNVSVGGGDELWTALAFATKSSAALMGLGLGETVALQGTPNFTADGEDGEGRLKIRKALFVAAILTARGWPREPRRKKPVKPAFPQPSLFDWKPEPEFDDAIPF